MKKEAGMENFIKTLIDLALKTGNKESFLELTSKDQIRIEKEIHKIFGIDPNKDTWLFQSLENNEFTPEKDVIQTPNGEVAISSKLSSNFYNWNKWAKGEGKQHKYVIRYLEENRNQITFLEGPKRANFWNDISQFLFTGVETSVIKRFIEERTKDKKLANDFIMFIKMVSM
jgi:hypothetical protein